MARALIGRLVSTADVADEGMRAIYRDAETTMERRHKAAEKTLLFGPRDIKRVLKVGLRPDLILELERRWRSLPELGRIGASEIVRHLDKSSFAATEARVVSRTLWGNNWKHNKDEKEAAASFVRCELVINRAGVHLTSKRSPQSASTPLPEDSNAGSGFLIPVSSRT
jgi:hypothetical protein